MRVILGVSERGRRFRELDSKELENIAVGGERKSSHFKLRATNAFDEWRRFWGYSTKKYIGEMSEEEDIRDFVKLLVEFVLQVNKQDGSLYPLGS